MTRRILLLGLVSALALVLGFVSFTAPQAVLAVRYAGYWIVLVATVWFGYHLGPEPAFRLAGGQGVADVVAAGFGAVGRDGHSPRPRTPRIQDRGG